MQKLNKNNESANQYGKYEASKEYEHESLLRKINRFIMGDDVFISYARKDATTYSLALASRLTLNKFSCYLDQWGAPPGEKLPKKLVRTLNRSSALVLLGTVNAAKSDAVRKEIEEFLKTGRTIIPISFEGALEKAEWFNLIKGLAITPESNSALEKGEPSEQVLNRIINASNFTRRSIRLRRYFMMTVLAVFLFLGAGAVIGNFIVSSFQTLAQAAHRDAQKYLSLSLVRQASSLIEVKKMNEGSSLLHQALDTYVTNELIAKSFSVPAPQYVFRGYFTRKVSKFSPFQDIALSSNGNYSAFVESDSLIQVISLNDNKKILISAVEGPVSCLAFSYDGQMLAVGLDKPDHTMYPFPNSNGRNGARVMLFDTSTGDHVYTFYFRNHFSPVRSVALNKEGKLAAAISDYVVIWDLSTKNQLTTREIKAETSIQNLTFSNNEKWIALRCTSGDIELWDLERKEKMGKSAITAKDYPLSKMNPNQINFNSNDSLLVAGTKDGYIYVFDAYNLTKYKRYKTNEGGVTTSLFIDKDLIVTGGWDRSLNFVKIKTFLMQDRIGGFSEGVFRAVSSEDGAVLLVSDYDGNISVFKKSPTIALSKEYDTSKILGYNKKEKTWIIAPLHAYERRQNLSQGLFQSNMFETSDTSTVVLKLLNNSTKENSIGYVDYSIPSKLSYTLMSNGNFLFFKIKENQFRIIDLRTNLIWAEIALPEEDTIGASTISSDGKFFTIASYRNLDERLQTISVYDCQKQSFIKSINVKLKEGELITSLSFDPINKYLAAGTFFGAIYKWDTNSWKKILVIPDQVGSPVKVEFAPIGEIIFGLSASGQIFRFDLAQDTSSNSKVLAPILFEEGRPTSLSFHPNGEIMAVSLDDGKIQFYDLFSGSLLSNLDAHEEQVITTIMFSPDGNSLAVNYASGNFNIINYKYNNYIRSAMFNILLKNELSSRKGQRMSELASIVPSYHSDTTDINFWKLYKKSKFKYSNRKTAKRMIASLRDTSKLNMDRGYKLLAIDRANLLEKEVENAR